VSLALPLSWGRSHPVDGRSLLELDPLYDHERFQRSRAGVEDVVERGEEWVRRRDARVRADVEKYERTAGGIDRSTREAAFRGPHPPQADSTHPNRALRVRGLRR
jgi:hypothetical protein